MIGLAIGAVMFLIVPVAAAFGGFVLFKALRALKETARLKEAHPGAPWMWRTDWAARRSDYEVGTAALWVVWGFALAWYGFLGVIALALIAQSARRGSGPFLFLGVFAVAGLLPLFIAIRSTWHRMRFGRSTFVMDTAPFALGGWVSGVVHAPEAARDVDQFNFALDCSEVWSSGSGKNRSTHQRLLWREEAIVSGSHVDRDSLSARVPVAIAVPADARETSGETDKKIEWRLRVSAVRRGLDYEASFDVPVFAGADVPAEPPRLPSLVRPDGVQPAGSRIRVEAGPSAAAFQYPTPSWLAGWIVVPLLLVPVAAVVGTVVFPNDTASVLVCVAVGLGVALLALLLTGFGILTTPNRVEIRPDVVAVRRGLFGRGWDRRIPRSEIVAVKFVPLQNGPRVDYSVDIGTRDGRSYNAALSLRDLGEAKWLAAEIERRARLPG